jgi:hypothetical protein
MRLPIIVFTFSLAFAVTSQAGQLAPLESAKRGGDDVSTMAFCQEKRLREDLDLLNAPIRSRRDLVRHLRASRDEGSPLLALSEEGRRRFLSSLTFNEKGVTGYRYDDLERELTATEAYLILALFGVQGDVARMQNLREETFLDRELKSLMKTQCQNGDYMDYRCESRATCTSHTRYICKASC